MLTRGGYTLDTGPSVFTAPEVLAEAFAAVGESMAARLTLTPLDTTYRALYEEVDDWVQRLLIAKLLKEVTVAMPDGVLGQQGGA